MRIFPLPLVLAGLLGSASLTPAAALAYPNDLPRYSYESYGSFDSYGPLPSPNYVPLPVNPPYGYRSGYGMSYDDPIASEPVPYPPASGRSCNRGTVLTGAAIGGGLGALLASNSRNRRWSLPMGAAMGGILGGIVSGC